MIVGAIKIVFRRGSCKCVDVWERKVNITGISHWTLIDSRISGKTYVKPSQNAVLIGADMRNAGTILPDGHAPCLGAVSRISDSFRLTPVLASYIATACRD